MLTDPRVFTDDHLPRALLHREAEVAQLSRAFQPVLAGDPAQDVLISGPSGVGKTVLSRYALRRLDERTATPSMHVRALGRTTAGILRALLESHPRGPSQVAQNTPTSDLKRQLSSLFDEPAIVVLDEADDLPETDALQILADLPQLATVIICHNPGEWLARVAVDVAGRYEGDHHVSLERYRADELADILEKRAEQGLPQPVWSRSYLENIADVAAGVARRGIQTLRAAAELCDERNERHLRAVDVEVAYERARRQIREANLKSLPMHHQLLYELIREAGEIGTDALNTRYDAVADAFYHGRPSSPISRRDRRNKLTKLREYDLVGWDGPEGHPTYWVRDENLVTPLEIDVERLDA